MDCSHLPDGTKVRVVSNHIGVGATLNIGDVLTMRCGRAVQEELDYGWTTHGEGAYAFEPVDNELVLNYLKTRLKLLAEQATSDFGLGRKQEVLDLLKDFFGIVAEVTVTPIATVEFTPCS